MSNRFDPNCLQIFISRQHSVGSLPITIFVVVVFQSGLTLGAFEIDEPWTLAEETMLLDAVEQYGFGNW